MVILNPSSKHSTLWNTEVKMHNPENFKCTCLVKGDVWPSSDILLGLGPEMHLSGKRSRRTWSRPYTRLPPACIFGSRIMETWVPLQPIMSARARDKGKFVCRVKSKLLTSKHFSHSVGFEDKCCYDDTSNGIFRDSNQPVEEPWLLQSPAPSHYGGDTDVSSENKIFNYITSDLVESESRKATKFVPIFYSNSEDNLDSKNFEPHSSIPEIYYPVEEPWLFQQSIVTSSFGDEESVNKETADLQSRMQHLKLLEKISLGVEGGESLRLDATNLEPHDQLQDIKESLLLDEESRSSLKNNVTTVILINSSLCTMQRIAVLEDDKLVELLLEPVKDNVQCDNVYLGVVTKLVPRMKGAFVNIGCSRPSFMDIVRDRAPFIFPPFHQPIKQSGANSLPGDPVVNGIENNSHDVEVVDDESINDSVEYMQDDFCEHDTENEFGFSEILNENMNGSVVGSEVEVDDEQDFDQLDECSHDSHSHHLDKRNNKTKKGSKWDQVEKGTKIIVQVAKEGLGSKGPTLTAYPVLRSRFWVLRTRRNMIGVSKKISGSERARLRVIAQTLKPKGFGLTVRTVAVGHSCEELQKDLEGLLSTWKVITERAKSAALAADEGVGSAIPVLLHKAMGQTLSVVQDYFNDKVKSMVVDSPRTYHEVTNYLQEIAPDLCDRVELYSNRTPLFDEYNIEEEVNNMLSKRVSLSNGGYLVIEQTEALVSIDVNGGQCMLDQGTSHEKAVLGVNLAAAKQIARELRLRDIGGIIVVDFIDMQNDSWKRLVYEEIRKAVERDRSVVNVSKLSKNGLMEITRKRVRPSVTFMFSEPCSSCHGTGRVQALETAFSKIEHEICRLLATVDQTADPGNPRSWPKFILRVDHYLCDYLTSGKRTRLAVLSSSLKVWVLLKVARGFTRGAFELKVLTDDRDNRSQNQAAISLARPKAVGTRAPNTQVTIFPIKKKV